MSDIVDWLKKECPRDSLARDARLQEAADEIETLRQRVAGLEHAIDDKMVVAHLGVFEKGDDPTEAVCKLMNYAQSLGEYFIKDKLATSQDLLKEARANDLQSMRYLSEIRGMVGGDDYPDMIARIAELVRSEK